MSPDHAHNTPQCLDQRVGSSYPIGNHQEASKRGYWKSDRQSNRRAPTSNLSEQTRTHDDKQTDLHKSFHVCEFGPLLDSEDFLDLSICPHKNSSKDTEPTDHTPQHQLHKPHSPVHHLQACPMMYSNTPRTNTYPKIAHLSWDEVTKEPTKKKRRKRRWSFLLFQKQTKFWRCKVNCVELSVAWGTGILVVDIHYL